MPRDYVIKPFHAPVDLQIDYAAELNPQQHAAVTSAPGPALVIAGAGSGKTRTLTYRVAFLLEQGIPPDRILLLTFTNKAAREMMGRVSELLGREMRELWGGTFHSIGARVLRRNAEQLNYRPDFSILDREDSTDLIKTCVAAAEIDTKQTRFPKADLLMGIFSMAVNQKQSIAEVVAEGHPHFIPITDLIEKVGQLYHQRKRDSNVMDFDDLLVRWLDLLEQNESVRRHYQGKFQFILVDEYQDTNRIQSDIIELLGGGSGNIMVVGDDSQSIYSWRGANFRNILDFPKRHPDAQVFKIEINYRSTPEILNVANAAIRANVEQFTKRLEPAKSGGVKPILAACDDANQQSAFVAQRMLELREEGVPLENMAVLYRAHFHALELQLELTRRNIPFSISSGIRFFEQAHIKDVSAYLKWVNNPMDELSFKRLVLMLPGVGARTADKLWQRFRGLDNADVAADLMSISKAVPKKAELAWAQFAATISQLHDPAVNHQPAKMIRLVVDAGYDEYLKATHTNWRQRLDDVEQLENFAMQFSDTTEFLTQLSLLTNVEAESDRTDRQGDDDERVKLSTIHQAKGLEFDVVFIIMLCDGLFPSERSMTTQAGEEEERRLFYVAVTRARQELYLIWPFMRAMASYGGDAMQHRSRFLDEIPEELIDEWNLRGY